jgi:hypothetical protein
MKRIAFILISALALMPVFAFADCSNQGATVIYINGVFESKSDADADMQALKYEYQKRHNDNINFLVGYNGTEGGGADDLVESAMNSYGDNVNDYDLQDILIQVQGELKTRKVLLVGYSEGTYYTNAVYDYLTTHGVDKSSVAVYNIASPAWYVAGGGNYLTSSTDNAVSGLVTVLAGKVGAKKPLPPNITLQIPASELNDPTGGHLLTTDYLAYAPDRIVGDMQKELNGLQGGQSSGGTCFAAPTITAIDAYMREDRKELDLWSDLVTWATSTALTTVQTVGTALADQIIQLAKNTNGGASVAGAVGNVVAPVTTGELASQTSTAPKIGTPETESNQDAIDDIEENLDLAKAQLAAGSSAPLMQTVSPGAPVTQPTKKTSTVTQTTNSNLADDYFPGGGTTYPSILISEVEVSGATDSKQEFVELYNPNDYAVGLTGWYLQRKTSSATSWATYAPNALFAGAFIPANGFFLIARTGYYAGTANAYTDNPITDDNSFALKDPNGDIIDQLGFGNAIAAMGGAAPDPAPGQSVGRKVLADKSEKDAGINATDFELQNLTPKAQNQTYTPIVSFPSDTKAPTVSFTSNAVQTATTFPVAFTITDLASVVSPSGIASYTFRWQDVTINGSWQQDVVVPVAGSPQSVSETRAFTGIDGHTYNFQVEATDADGNASDWLPDPAFSIQVELPQTILINEIQTNGATSTDEFVELYNPNSVAVNLQGFSLTRKTSTGTEHNLVSSGSFTGTIASHGYFLIAPQGYTTVTPDLTYSGASSSFNIAAKDNTVLLYNNNGVLLDKVGFGAAIDFEGVPTVNPPANESIERKIIGGDTDNNLNDFRLTTTPTPGKSFMQATLTDSTNFKDNLGFADDAPFYQLALRWASPSPNLASFEVQYQINGGTWKDWMPAGTTAPSGTFTAYYSLLSLSNVYNFRVQAKDSLGNLSDWTQISDDLSVPVVINEIALYGTTASQNDQWLELYNRSASDVDLTGWTIVSGNNTITLQGIIPAKGYFLLENDPRDIAGITANQIFSGTLSNSLTQLLAANNRYMDEAAAGGTHWQQFYFSQNGNTYAMERVSDYALGGPFQNWKINDGVTMNGLDRSGNPIYGTPGSLNSDNQLYTFIPQDFWADTEFPASLSPYVFYLEPVVQEGVTLTIDPGSIIKFYDAHSSLTISGTLNAIGTNTNQIVFTSFEDDSVGGDSNGDGAATSGVEGQWMGIEFMPTSQNSDMENAIFRYGGGTIGFSPPGWGRVLWANNSSFTLKDSIVEDNQNYAMYLDTSNSTVDNVQFLRNDDNTSVFQQGTLYIDGGSPVIENSDFEQDSKALVILSGTAAVENNTFSGNTYPIIWGGGSPVFSNNQMSNDVHEGIRPPNIASGIVELPAGTYVAPFGVTVNDGATYIIDAGVTILFDGGAGLEVDGTLIVNGTMANPVVFTSSNPSPQPNAWQGIDFTSTSSGSQLQYLTVEYAGASPYLAGIKVDQTSIQLQNSIVENNSNNGIMLNNSNSVIDGVQFSGNGTAVSIQGGSPEVKNSTFQGNTQTIVSQGGATPNLHDQDPADPEQNTFL